MSAFYVGQRVRIVGAGPRSMHLIGRETVIVGIDVLGYNRVEDVWYTGIETAERFGNDGTIFVAKPHYLEPIQYDGMKPVSWGECLWQPESERVSQ